MTTQQNIRAVLETNFSQTKDEIIENAVNVLDDIIEGTKVTEVWVVSRMIPEVFSMELKFFSNERAAKEYFKLYKAQGATCNKYPLIDSVESEVEVSA